MYRFKVVPFFLCNTPANLLLNQYKFKPVELMRLIRFKYEPLKVNIMASAESHIFNAKQLHD